MKVHSGNTVTEYETQGKCKIQLTMTINFISSKDSDEIRTMHTKSNNIEIMIDNETDKLLKNFLNLLCKNIKKD